MYVSNKWINVNGDKKCDQIGKYFYVCDSFTWYRAKICENSAARGNNPPKKKKNFHSEIEFFFTIWWSWKGKNENQVFPIPLSIHLLAMYASVCSELRRNRPPHCGWSQGEVWTDSTHQTLKSDLDMHCTSFPWQKVKMTASKWNFYFRKNMSCKY